MSTSTLYKKATARQADENLDLLGKRQQQIDNLEAERDRLRDEKAMWEKGMECKDKAHGMAINREFALGAVLEFYGNAKLYECEGVAPMDAPRICQDGGKRARDALAGKGGDSQTKDPTE